MSNAAVRHSVDLLFFGADGKMFLQFRDSQTRKAPLTFSFWGGAVTWRDGSILDAAVRETREELALSFEPDDFTLCGRRVGSDGKRAHLLQCRRRIGWGELRILEGAGGAFLSLAELDSVPVTTSLRHYREHDPRVLAPDAPPLPDADFAANVLL